jgi:hypothetical protein
MTRPLRRSYCLLFLALMTQAGCGRGGPDAGTSGTGAGANTVSRDLPMEPLPTDPRAELSNLRFGIGRTGREKYSVNWRWTKKGPDEMDMTLVIRPSKGGMLTVHVNAIGKKSGTVSGEIMSNRPKGEEIPLQSGCEMYLVISRGAHYKISNSVTSGDASVTPTRPHTP